MIANGMHKWAAFALAAAFILVACGGGSGNNVAGIDRTGGPVIASYGTVSAFGSVVVNGVHFDTTQTAVTIDDSPGTVADLAIGDVVLVKGTLNSDGATGVANSVSFENNVVGPVSSIDTAANTLVVLGQLVRVNADTSFAPAIQPASLAGVAVGDILEVSGLVQNDESIAATRVGRRPAGGEFEVTGVVAGNNGSLHTFSLSALPVSYGTAELVGFTTGAVANGDRVRAKGTLASGVLNATRVASRSDPLGGASGERRDVEGTITRFVSATDFDVSGLKVTTNARTSFEDGTAADLGLSVKVEAEGALDDKGVLVATKIELKRSASMRLVGPVDSINAAAGSFSVLGVSLRVDAMTRLEDQSSQQVRPFSLANLALGDSVEVRGVESPAGSGQLLATFVERENAQSQVAITGFVVSVSPPQLFVVLGIQISTGAGTKFDGINGVANLKPGDRVQVEGQKVGDRAVSATEVEVDD